MKISRLGEAPDYRFSLANERTFLAWIRTSLGFLAGGIGLDQLGGTARHSAPQLHYINQQYSPCRRR